MFIGLPRSGTPRADDSMRTSVSGLPEATRMHPHGIGATKSDRSAAQRSVHNPTASQQFNTVHYHSSSKSTLNVIVVDDHRAAASQPAQQSIHGKNTYCPT